MRTLKFALRYDLANSLLEQAPQAGLAGGQTRRPARPTPSEDYRIVSTTGRPDADVRVNHGKPIPESKPARRAFNMPNAAGVSRDTDAGPN